jgi:transposase InsO family protein
MSTSRDEHCGLSVVCEVAGVARSSVYAQRRSSQAMPSVRRGPKTQWSDEALVEQIRTQLQSSPFVGEGYRKVWAKLRFAGIRTSKPRVLRLMRKHGLQAPTRCGGPRGPRIHDGTIIPEAPDLRWGTDLTTTFTLEEGQASVLLAVDHYTAEIVGIHAVKRATRWEALEPIRQGVRKHFGAIGRNVASGLELRHDHGSQYMSDAFQQEIAFLGIQSSPSFVRAPEGNGCAERAIRTLKEQLLWIRSFATIEELRRALIDWAELYNERWMIERHQHRSPTQARREYYAANTKLAA